ncbi:hypothetical protein CMQ_5149 [Grosmannia clavigera kw1407]|uniref:Uncharacterized protein n=1 Tax=Grosmannia clavigera (strain kw1407 / UAMH 11150) TaxID=655863 RepID=F0XB69_GROCL|nr:uncharacterized protein CMQ_5149 [Grosmannia clavigera kw1407]EFX04887.1 hypothetical protein CMQ_5149 [Grosmannia clavigera kw1407]
MICKFKGRPADHLPEPLLGAGDGYADYLCISPDDRTTTWLQDPSSSSPNRFVPIGQIVSSQTSDTEPTSLVPNNFPASTQ